MIKKIFYLFFLFFLSFNVKAQNTPITTSTKATAQLSATCSISASNIGFGQLILPLVSQSSSSSMNVLCSKNASYTIGLSYGGVYGQGGQTSTIALTSGSKVTGGSACYYGSIYQYQYGSPYCAPSITTTTTTYAYGKMIGVAKGDNVAYSIAVPGNSSQVWNSGENSYSTTGTGANQIIPLNAQLVPSQTTNSYPTPDIYMDTVTATVNF